MQLHLLGDEIISDTDTEPDAKESPVAYQRPEVAVREASAEEIRQVGLTAVTIRP